MKFLIPLIGKKRGGRFNLTEDINIIDKDDNENSEAEEESRNMKIY